MRELLEAAISEVEHWQRLPSAAEIPAIRVANFREKPAAFHRIGSVGLLRTSMEHIFEALAMLGVPASEFAPSLLILVALLNER